MEMGDSEPRWASKLCSQPAHCPLCGQPNRCRLETGEAYKGPCWCEGPVLSASALNRLMAELPEQRCLCRACLEKFASDPEIAWETFIAQRRAESAGLLPDDPKRT